MAQIILGYDGSDAADAALETAIELARKFGDKLVIAYADLPPGSRRGEEFRAHQEALRELGVEATLKAERRAVEAEVEHEAVLIPNTPVDALLALSEERDARFIVIGNHGEGRLLGALLGTLPHKLPARTQIPVVVVRVHDE